MVSFWPFGRRDDNSPDSFERILAKVTTQITKQTAHLNLLRNKSRRYKALWTLYTVVTWTLSLVVLVLIRGWKNLNPAEVGGAVGGPFIIYFGRRVIMYYYDKRIATAEAKLADLQAERHENLEKLKTATKFYSTQQILEKYGGGGGGGLSGGDGKGPFGPGGGGGEAMSRQASNIAPHQQMQHDQQFRSRQPSIAGPPGPPPPGPQQQIPDNIDAHFMRATPERSPGPPEIAIQNEQLSPQQLQMQEQLRQQQIIRPISNPGAPIPPSAVQSRVPSISVPPGGQLLMGPPPPPSPGSQPNFIQPESGSYGSGGGRWYDRLLDVLIGEDETSSKNRLALICKNCRMVNGLAPPGTKDINEMGRWGCASCGAWNGKDGTVKIEDQIEREIAEEIWTARRGGGRSSARGSIRMGGSMRRKPMIRVDSEEEEDPVPVKREGGGMGMGMGMGMGQQAEEEEDGSGQEEMIRPRKKGRGKLRG